VEIRIHRLMDYLKAIRDFRSLKKVCFDLKKMLNARKVPGTVNDKLGKKTSCPTWRFKGFKNKEDFMVTTTLDQKQIEGKKDEEN
jgi:hypothetical protein